MVSFNIPTFQESNIKFINAVINWLSLFPNSIISNTTLASGGAGFNEIHKPDVVIQIFQMIIDDGFQIDYDLYAMEKELGCLDVVKEYELIFESVKRFFKANYISRKKLYKFCELLKFNELEKGDIFQVNCLCFIFLEVGLHCYKSSVCISMISLLNEDDENELKKFMYDEDDLNGKNLILNQKLNLLELENCKLKEDVNLYIKKITEMESNKLQQNEYDSELIKEYSQGVDQQKQEIGELQQQLEKLKFNNELLKQENKRLINDLEIIKDLTITERDMNIYKKSPVRKKKSPSIIDETEFDPYLMLKWEYNLMNEWIAITIKKTKSRPTN